MSQHEQIIRNFSDLHAKHPALFTQEDLASLTVLISAFSEEYSVEKIADELSLWCETHPHIDDALLTIPIVDVERSAGGSTTRLTTKVAKSLLENIVRTEPGNKSPEKSNTLHPDKHSGDDSSSRSDEQ